MIEDKDKENLLIVRDLYKGYVKNQFILQGLDMTVREGEIYCLLGASGCGKSTLLNIIVGLSEPHSGRLETTLTSRDQMGYMTQETSLYEQLNIGETFHYYGTVYGFSKEEIKVKGKELTDLLELPELSRNVAVLSGGQRRRVSLAITLFPNPKLLILDEPTVGVDPILRQSIWDHLVRLCEEEKKTVIITTHYIEEGQQAHTVAFMRKGRLLCEKPPKHLFEIYHTNNLEDVFLYLSKDQELEEKGGADEDEPQNTKQNTQQDSYDIRNYPLRLKASSKLNVHKILGEINKNFIYLKRNLSVAAFTLLIPAFSICIFSFTCGREPDQINFGVFNEEIPTSIQHCDEFIPRHECKMEYLSCLFVEGMRDTQLNLIEYDDLEQGLHDVRVNKIWGLAHFSLNYSRALHKIMIYRDLKYESWLDNNGAKIYLDESNLIMRDFMKRDIRDSFRYMMKHIFKNCGWLERASEFPMKFEQPIYGEKDPDLRIYYASPAAALILLTTPLMYGLTIMIEEKKSGATTRSIIAGVSVFEVMISHLIVQCCLQVIQTLMVVIVAYGILAMPFNRPFLTVTLFVLQSLTGISIAFTISMFTDSLSVSNAIHNGYSMIALWIGGTVWPLEAIPQPIRFISWVLPSTLPIEAIRAMTIRGTGIGNYIVYWGFLSSLIWMSTLIVFIFIYVKRTRGKTYIKT